MSLIKADTYIVKERRGEEKGVYIERRVSREECREKSVERRVSREECREKRWCGIAVAEVVMVEDLGRLALSSERAVVVVNLGLLV
jgi:hypothetical protein